MSELKIHTFVVGDKEYQCLQLDAFTVNTWHMKIKGIVFGLLSQGADTNLFNLMNIVDEKTLDRDLFPLFDAVQLTCTSDRVKLKDKSSMNQLFTAETLMDFYSVAWEVVKFNFGPFIAQLVKNLFGLELSSVQKILQQKMQKVGEAAEKLD